VSNDTDHSIWLRNEKNIGKCLVMNSFTLALCKFFISPTLPSSWFALPFISKFQHHALHTRIKHHNGEDNETKIVQKNPFISTKGFLEEKHTLKSQKVIAQIKPVSPKERV
jgi:hypothetical protein